LFSPRNSVEKAVGEVMRFVHPYLAFVTYRFHVEKSRDAGKYSYLNIILSNAKNTIIFLKLIIKYLKY
jgi:hypothetical protein